MRSHPEVQDRRLSVPAPSAIAALALIAWLSSPASVAAAERRLGLDERIQARRAIEQVYWNHRLWPADNPGPKPPLSAVLSAAEIRARVEDDLRKSRALEIHWNRPITRDDLQAEMNRMVASTRAPRVLRELFQALDNDPDLIAEALARPALANVRIRESWARDARGDGEPRRHARAALAAHTDFTSLSAAGSARYRETTYSRWSFGPRPRVRGALVMDDSQWRSLESRLDERLARGSVGTAPGSMALLQESSDEFSVSAVIERNAGTIRVATHFWPKPSFDAWWREQRAEIPADIAFPGGGYTLDSASVLHDLWTPTSTGDNVPGPRRYHTAVWTGAEMIVWGGDDYVSTLGTGARYVPATDTWSPTSMGGNAPSGRSSHSAVWTGTRMLVWGGYHSDSLGSGPVDDGARYDPVSDTWETMAPPTGVLPGVSSHTAVWTGTEMIVWGGAGESNTLYTGGRYDPAADTWQPTSAGTNVPQARTSHTAVWAGGRMIVWGGRNTGGNFLSTGGSYDPATNSWTRTSGLNAPSARHHHTAVSTGAQMVVWGGSNGPSAFLDSGARYDPAADTWTATSTTDAPSPREYHSAVWTGAEMIVWGGMDDFDLAASGGRYRPSADSWVPTPLPAPSWKATPREHHTAVWAGSEMIVWGGFGVTYPPTPGVNDILNTGAHYGCPSDQLLYADMDGDGHGGAGPPQACDFGGPVPPSYGRPGDCDDANSSIHPGASDVLCNGIDDDCDGVVDGGTACVCTENGPGLIAWWRGNDTTLDEVGANHGTLAGGSSYGPGLAGSAFDFDGVSGHVAGVGDPQVFSFVENTGVFTINAWIHLDDVNALSTQAILANTATATEKGHFFVWDNSAGQRQLLLGLTSGSGTPKAHSRSPQDVITTGGWHHVAVTANSFQVTFHVDGVAYPGSGVIGGGVLSGPSTRPADIGQCPAPSPVCRFDGRIDEVQIHDRFMTAAQIRAIYDAGSEGMCGTGCRSSIPGLVGWWPGNFDGTDRSPAHNHLFVPRGVGFTNGVVGAGFELLGAGMEAPDDPSLEVTSQLTLAAWVLPYGSAPNNSARIISKWASGAAAYELLFDSNDDLRLRANVSGDGTTFDALVAPAPLGAGWHHVATTFDGGDWRLYVDGAVVAGKTSAITTLHAGGTSPLGVGRVPLGANPFQGVMDEPMVFHRALAAAEIQALYGAGSDGVCGLGEVVSVEPPEVPPASFALAPAWPNPSSGTTRVRFTLPAPVRVRAEVMDLEGRRVAVLADERIMAAGPHSLAWDGRDRHGRLTPPGIFQIRVLAGREMRVSRVVRIR